MQLVTCVGTRDRRFKQNVRSIIVLSAWEWVLSLSKQTAWYLILQSDNHIASADIHYIESLKPAAQLRTAFLYVYCTSLKGTTALEHNQELGATVDCMQN